MLTVVHSSYKLFYVVFISILWALAVSLAVLQSGFAISFIAKAVIPEDANISFTRVNGGLLTGFGVENLKIRNDISAKNLFISADILHLLQTKELKVSLLKVDGLNASDEYLVRLSEKNETKITKPDFIDKISVTTARIEAKNIYLLFDQFRLTKAQLNVRRLTYDFSDIRFDIDGAVATNVVEAKLNGTVANQNYEAVLDAKPVANNIINRLSEDKDFDYNGIKSAKIKLSGDSKGMKIDLQGSAGVIYKHFWDLSVKDVQAAVDIRFKPFYIRVVAKKATGSTKYGDASAAGYYVYDKRSYYEANGTVQKLLYAPIGRFHEHIDVKELKNGKVSVAGDAKEVAMKIAGDLEGSVKAYKINEPLSLKNCDAKVGYQFKSGNLQLQAAGKAESKYGEAEFKTVVAYKDGKVSYGVEGELKRVEHLGVAAEALANGEFYASGPADKILAKIDSKLLRCELSSKDFSNFNVEASTGRLYLKDIYSPWAEKFKNSFVALKLKAEFNSDKESLHSVLHITDSSILGRKVLSNEFIFDKNKNSFSVEGSRLQIGEMSFFFEAKKDGDSIFAKAQTNSSSVTLSGTTSPLKISASANISSTDSFEKELSSLFLFSKVDIRGKLNGTFDISGDIKAPMVKASINSPQLDITDSFVLQDMLLLAEYQGGSLKLKSAELKHKDKKYRLMHEADFVFEDEDGIRVKGFNLNGMLMADGVYKNGIGSFGVIVKNFEYSDPMVAAVTFNGEGMVTLRDSHVSIDGEGRLSKSKIFYSPPAVKISKDKDIKIISGRPDLSKNSFFVKNFAVNMHIVSDSPVEYKSNGAEALIEPNFLLYKDYDKKVSFDGMIKILKGSYMLEGKKFIVKEGDIALLKNFPDDPYLNMTLFFSEDKDLDINIFVSGFLSSPTLNFSSRPAMSEKDIISYLLFGVDSEKSFAQTSSQANYASKAVGLLSTVLKRDLQNEFGIKLDKIEVTPSDDAKKPSTVEVGKKITKDLMVIYKNNIDSSVGIEYQFNKNFGAQSEVGSKKGSVDLFYRLEY